MKNKTNWLELDLQLFAEGAGAEGGMAASGVNGDTSSGADAARTSKGRENPLANVVYGKTEPTVKEQTARAQTGKGKPDGTSDPEKAESKADAYARMKAQYKELYDADVQEIIRQRFKKANADQEQLKELSPVLELLAEKYGADISDPKALLKALEEDDSFYEEEAMEKGVSVAELKRTKSILRENRALKKQMAEQQRQENAAKVYSEWMREAEDLKKIYPSFNLESELQNERFVNLLKAPGVGVRNAFELVHRDEIMPAYTYYVENKAKEAVANSVRAGAARPDENGLSGSAPAVTKSDPSSWTKQDRDEISRRVARGEKIRL